MLALLFLLVPAAWSGDTRPPTPPPATPPAATPGVIALEPVLVTLGATRSDLFVVSIRFEDGIAPPDTLRDRQQHQGWTEIFGERVLTVQHERVGDGRLLSESTARQPLRRKPKQEPRELCVATHPRSGDEVALRTWAERGGDVLAPELSGDTSLFYVQEEGRRTALVALAPGESATVVELIGDAGNHQPRRRVDLARADRQLSMHEGNGQDQVCVRR